MQVNEFLHAKIKPYGLGYETCRIAGLRHYPPLQKLVAGQNHRIPTETGMFYDRVLGTGGFYSQFVYLSCLYCLEIQFWSGKGEKALWQNLDVAKAWWVLLPIKIGMPESEVVEYVGTIIILLLSV